MSTAIARSRGSTTPRLPIARLPEVARWIAPEQVPVRFDARYYAARMDERGGSRAGRRRGGEGLVGVAAPLLSAWESEEVLFYWPTHFTMRRSRTVAMRKRCSGFGSRPVSPTTTSSVGCRGRSSTKTDAFRSGECSLRTPACTRWRGRTRGSSGASRRS